MKTGAETGATFSQAKDYQQAPEASREDRPFSRGFRCSMALVTSPAFSKPSLNIWDVSVHILLKPNLKDIEHNLASM